MLGKLIAIKHGGSVLSAPPVVSSLLPSVMFGIKEFADENLCDFQWLLGFTESQNCRG